MKPKLTSVDWIVIGRTIRAARKAQQPKMTQGDLGKMVGLGQQMISFIENGRPTTTASLEAVCIAVGLQLDVNLRPPGAGSERHSPGVIETAALLHDLPQEERDAVRAMLRSLPHMPEDMRRGIQMQFALWAEVYKSGRSHSQAVGE